MNLLLPNQGTVQQKDEQAIAERVAAEFAGQAWVAMFGAATAAAIEANEADPAAVAGAVTGIPEWPTEKWQDFVLRTLLGLMEPYASMTSDHALVRLIEDWGNAGDAGALQAELQSAVATLSSRRSRCARS